QAADSPLSQGSYRALAATANHFARESHIDELAHAAGVDPVEFRLRQLDDERLATVVKAAADQRGTRGSGNGTRQGFGIAAGLEKGGRVATSAEVRVNGNDAVEVTRLVTVYECGAIVNPDTVRNQVEGAAIMALGGALFEQLALDHGHIADPALAAYRVPRFSDAPAVEVVLIDRPDLPSAGAGETPLIAVAPAIANAIFDATGRRLRSLPLVPDGVMP
ncbi:MAG: molybdopterin cofactor-binding domain-containing protein, partial [Acidimicrobiia bacterium]